MQPYLSNKFALMTVPHGITKAGTGTGIIH